MTNPSYTGGIKLKFGLMFMVCTQRSWKRPYGVDLLVAGLNEFGAHLYYNCLSGNYFDYQAFAISSRSQAAKTYLECKFENFMNSSLEDLIEDALIATRESAQGEKLNIFACTIAIVEVGHIDGKDPAPKDAEALAKWKIKDARVMTWIMSSVEPHIVLNLRPYKIAKEMWKYLKKGDVPDVALTAIIKVHESSKRNQFLMKLCPDFKMAHSNLMNRDPVPSLDACLSALLRKEQRLLTQASMEQKANANDLINVAYAAHGRSKGKDVRGIQCYSCKGFGHIAKDCSQKFCNYCKQWGHIISSCPTRPVRREGTAYHASVGASSSAATPMIEPDTAAPSTSSQNPNTLTPEMVQQMIFSVFSAFGFSSSSNSHSLPWYIDSEASNHMTNTTVPLSNVQKYDGTQKIHTANGNSLDISVVGDISPSLTNVFVSFGLSTNLISVGQLVDHDCNVQFSSFGCIVQDQVSRKIIAKGPKIFLQNKGIISQHSCPSTSQQNGIAERKNRHLLDVVRTLLLESSVPPRFLCKALSTAVHLINRLPSPVLGNVSPFHKLHGYTPSSSGFRTFGCVCFVHLPIHKRHKLAAQSVKCAFLDYSNSQKGYICYDSSAHRMRISRNVIFFEK
ncbi:uncharacterized protein LOC113871425 [Abrus precatorius]|uniref:Uncharacterized protein LOC113871425 n=1 Tax=Abrus precatorius TaxID=3816 RepID=A0A8B8M6M1_ABRPR|nr:uncharacterized protein LOC113871425 [Abrus precatorius]